MFRLKLKQAELRANTDVIYRFCALMKRCVSTGRLLLYESVVVYDARLGLVYFARLLK
jgi:hypothetical protein